MDRATQHSLYSTHHIQGSRTSRAIRTAINFFSSRKLFSFASSFAATNSLVTGSLLALLATAYAPSSVFADSSDLASSGVLSSLSTVTIVQPTDMTASAASVPQAVRLKGWGYMYGKFQEAGVETSKLTEIFSDPRLPSRDTMIFSLKPRESHYNYRKLNTAPNRTRALKCYLEYQPYFDRAERDFRVPSEVILSILQVETACGKNTGNTSVLPRLLRLAAAATPENVAANIKSHQAEARTSGVTSTGTSKQVQERAQWLEKTFLPHAIGVLKVAGYKGVEPYELRGSSAGAIGMPQFLPGHYLSFGVDADRSGRVDLFNGPDAILSVGKYLNHFGWNREYLTRSEQRNVIWEYNRSIPYIDTVLGMAKLLKPQIQKLRGPRVDLSILRNRLPQRAAPLSQREIQE